MLHCPLLDWVHTMQNAERAGHAERAGYDTELCACPRLWRLPPHKRETAEAARAKVPGAAAAECRRLLTALQHGFPKQMHRMCGAPAGHGTGGN